MDNDYTDPLNNAKSTDEILNLISLLDDDRREIKRIAVILLAEKNPNKSRLASLQIELNELAQMREMMLEKQRRLKKSEALARKTINRSHDGFLAAFLEAASELLSKKEFTKIKKRADDKLLTTKVHAQRNRR